MSCGGIDYNKLKNELAAKNIDFNLKNLLTNKYIIIEVQSFLKKNVMPRL